ncbi:MAG: hypothetical protein WCK82_12365 [Bacteroidota bacterium]
MNLVQQIKDAVRSGKVKEPFKSPEFHFLSGSPSFISKHAVGNGKYTEYFIRVVRGAYRLK